jgi:5-amino-6-(5-phosphoribosylamino)uracil reductase
VRLRCLYPEPGETSPEDLISGLGLAERAPEDRPYLALNMVSTLDGKAAVEGRTLGMSNEADRAIFHHLRTQANAVMVGAGTVREERYGRMIKTDELREKRRREGLEPDALAVVVSASLNLPSHLPLLQEPDQRVIVATDSNEELEGTEAHVDYLRTGDDLPLMLSRLREEHGVSSVLCEGGPTLNSHLFAADLVDELFMTIGSQVVGGENALTIVAGRPLLAPVRAELIWLYEGGGDLFGRWRMLR